MWGDFFSAPEPCLREAAWRNEVVVAQVRLVILSLLCAVPIVQLVVEPGELETWFGLAEAKASGRNRIVLASGPRTAVILVSEGRLTEAPGVE